MGVIRQDVVQISYEVENNPFQELNSSMDQLKQSVTGAVGDGITTLKQMSTTAGTAGDSIDSLAKSTQDTSKTFTELAAAAKNAVKVKVDNGLKSITSIPEKAKAGFDKLKSSLTSIKSIKLSDIGKGLDRVLGKGVTASGKLFKGLMKAAKVSMGGLLSGIKSVAVEAGKASLALGKMTLKGLGKAAGGIAKGVGAAVGAAAVAVGGLVKASVSAYADYEQLVGGVETLFGKSAPAVQKYAQNAYMTAGLSANQYMDTVTGFSASLLQSLGGDTKKAAKYADMAVTDMADNANKMGTDMESIQTAYQGFAKQNYTMLDNLKLGYGGTKEEMARLIKDAAKVDKSIDANSMSYANIVKAINVVQDKMGIAGTTKAEADKTISGSLNSLKSAWSNTLTSLVQGGDAFDESIQALVGSAKTFAKNVLPAAKSALAGVANLVKELAPMIAAEIPSILSSVLPAIVDAAVSMVDALISAIESNIDKLADMAVTIVTTIVSLLLRSIPKLIKIGAEIIVALANGIVEQLPTLMPLAIEAIQSIVNTLVALLPQLIVVGVQIIVALVQGLAQMLPQLIPTIINGILAMVSALLQQLPLLIQCGIILIFAVLQGLINALPQLITAGIQLIIMLINGIIQAIPMLIEAAIQMIPIIVEAILSNLPLIIEGAIQIMVALAVGLVQAIPQLIASIPKIIGAIIEGLFSIDWIQVGKDLIGSVWSGIKSLFGGGKDKGEEASTSVAAGITSGTGTATTAASNLAASTTNSLALNTGTVSGYGTSATNSLAGSLSAGTGSVVSQASQLSMSTNTAIGAGINTTAVGTEAVTNLAGGINSNIGTATSAASSLSTQVSDAAATDVDVKVNPDVTSLNIFKQKVAELVNVSSSLLKKLPNVFKGATTAACNAANANIIALNTKFRGGMAKIVYTTKAAMNGVRAAVASCNLFSSGVQIMRGLSSGMQSMRASVILVAKAIATSISNTINNALKIHSPSKLTTESGRYVGEGLINGISNMRDKVAASAKGLSTAVATNAAPVTNEYAPSSSTVSNTSNSSQINNYSPSFTINMNGTSATASNRSKVKKWVKDSIKETFDSMGRVNPEICEV